MSNPLRSTALALTLVFSGSALAAEPDRSPIAKVKSWWHARSEQSRALERAMEIDRSLEKRAWSAPTAADVPHAYREVKALRNQLGAIRDKVGAMAQRGDARFHAKRIAGKLDRIARGEDAQLSHLDDQVGAYMGRRVATMHAVNDEKAVQASLERVGWGYPKGQREAHLELAVKDPLAVSLANLTEQHAAIVKDANELKAAGHPLRCRVVRQVGIGAGSSNPERRFAMA